MRDYASLSRTEWLDLADRFYARLERSFDSLSPTDWNRVTTWCTSAIC